MEKTCIMMVGLPGVGKSTIIKELLKDNPELIVLSTDQFIENYAVKHDLIYGEAFKIMGDKAMGMMNAEIQKTIKAEKSFIWDQTNVVRSSRDKKLEILSKNNYKAILIVIELSEEEHQRRINKRKVETGKVVGEKIVNQMRDSYTRPGSDEVVNQIILIGDDGKYNVVFDKDKTNESNVKSKF